MAFSQGLSLLKSTFRRMSVRVRDRKFGPQSRAALHSFWKDPNRGQNRPEDYLEAPTARGEFVADLIAKHIPDRENILEIGCNVGRNLNLLHLVGFTGLSGIEISENAVKVMRRAYPEMASQAAIYNQPVEEIIREFADRQFNVVFTMAVLEHIHPDSEWIFADMARITGKLLITVENEAHPTWRQFPRNYRKVFEDLGLQQVEESVFEPVNELGLTPWYVARVFRRTA